MAPIETPNEQCYSNNVADPNSVAKTRTVSFSDNKQHKIDPIIEANNLTRAARFQFTPEEGHGRFVAKNLSQVFDSIDRRGESDRKVPRQARPVISRKDVEKSVPGRMNGPGNGPPSAHVSLSTLQNVEFRCRAQTAPVNSLKRRKDRERALANVIDNNNDESLDEGNGNNVESIKQNDKKQSKYRFAFKKNLAKENGSKDEVSGGKAINRRIKGREGNLTPNREILAQSAPVDESGDIQKLRTRSASASSNSERRRRTRRRRGRKSGTVDNEMTDLSFEDALHHLQEMEQMENQEMYYREGQTWTEDGIGCEMQVVGGTTYFTPIANQNPERTETSNPEEVAPYNGNGSGWSPSDGSEMYQEGPMFSSLKVESYEEFTPKTNRKVGFTQSAPMGGRTVKQESRLSNIEDLRENLKVIWSETERKLTKEEMKLAQSEQLASETALAAISIDQSTKDARVARPGGENAAIKSVESNRSTISKIWESDRVGASAKLPIKTKSVWEPCPAEQKSFERVSRDNSPTWSDGIWGKESNNSSSTNTPSSSGGGYPGGIGMDMSALCLSDPTSFFDQVLPPTQYPVNPHQPINHHHHHLNTGSSSDSWNDGRPIWDSQMAIAK